MSEEAPKKPGRRIATLAEFVELWPAVLNRVRKETGTIAVSYLRDAWPVALGDGKAVVEFNTEFHYLKASELAKKLPLQDVVNSCMAEPHTLVFRLKQDENAEQQESSRNISLVGKRVWEHFKELCVPGQSQANGYMLLAALEGVLHNWAQLKPAETARRNQYRHGFMLGIYEGAHAYVEGKEDFKGEVSSEQMEALAIDAPLRKEILTGRNDARLMFAINAAAHNQGILFDFQHFMITHDRFEYVGEKAIWREE
jgi:hypothetical protein